MVRQNKKQLKKIIPTIIAFIISFLILNITTLADSNSMGFSVTPILPENQNNPDIGYYDLTLSKGTEQIVALSVHNISDKEIKIEVDTNTASTSPTGKIDYTSKKENDITLKYSFAEIAQPLEKQIKIPANSKREVFVKINAPEEEFDGMILGGIRVKDITEKKVDDIPQTNGIQILNEYEYVIGFVLRSNTKPISPDFELVNVEAKTLHNRAGVGATFRNPKPDAVKKADFSAVITPKNSKKEIFLVKDFKIDMAPNSVMPFEFIDEKGYGISPGTYTLNAQIKYKDDVWNFEQDFTVSAKNASEINNESINIQNNMSKIPVWAIILLIIGILLIILLIILIIKNKKGDSEKDKKQIENFVE